MPSLPPPRPLKSGGQILSARSLGAGPRLLLLHGGPGLDHHFVLPLALGLAASFEVLLPDLPGHGRSHDGDAGLPDFSRVVECTARWAGGLEPPAEVVAGHSLGALVVREMLRLRRVTPRGAVLLCPPGVRPALPSPSRAWFGPRRTGTRNAIPALRQEILDFCRDDAAGELSPEMTHAIRESRLRPPGDYAQLLGQMRRLLAHPLAVAPEACPVLVLCGERDPVGAPDDVAPLAAATPGARTVVLAGAGHFPFASSATPVVEAVLEFAASCGVTRPDRARG